MTSIKLSLLLLLMLFSYNRCFSFPDTKLINKEYEMDIFMHYYMPDKNFSYLFSENYFRITAGSINIKHLFVSEELKIRPVLINDKFWARFIHKRTESIENQENLNEIEFEYSPVENVFLSFLGTPEFNKYDIDIGWALRYATNEANGIKITYILTDFDNNYAFHNGSVNLGFSKLYRNIPKKYRFEIKNNRNFLRSFLFFEYNTKAVYNYEDLNDSSKNYGAENKSYSIDTNLNSNLYFDWKIGLDFKMKKMKAEKSFVLTSPALNENYSESEIKYTIRPYIEKGISESVKIFSGVTFIKQDYNIFYPNLITNSFDFKQENIGGFALLNYELVKGSVFEFGYLHNNIDWSKNTDSDNRKENRIKFAYEHKFRGNTMLKFITGWDLDKRDWGKFAIFDGGHVQLQ